MALAFRFISGKYQGGELPIPDDGELIVGRAPELDIVLVEDMVSRKHAKLLATSGTVLVITDLGSTNGTFVNGEKVRRADLKRGDRILIGTSILKVIGADEMTLFHDTVADRDSLKEMMEELGNRAPQTANMSGELEEVPLPDLLQLLASNRRSGVLTIGGARRGKLYMKEGQIQHAVIGGEISMPPLKAFCRMITWSRGSFQLDPYDEQVHLPDIFEESTESLLIESLRQSDEIRRVMPDMPALDATLVMAVPLAPKLSELKEHELETLQWVINVNRFKSVIDRSPQSDHQVITNLHKLLKVGYIETR